MESKNVQAPISEQKIFKIMVWIVFPVCGVFLLKNVIGGNLTGILTVGITAVVFGGALITMRILKVSDEYRQLVAAIGLTFVEFVISLNSGDYYSDDFPLLLAIIAMTALYFKPKYTAIQLAVCDVLLILLYIIHPEKAESLSQYIMCVAIFNLAAFLIFLTIKRGRSYIAISENRACEAEKLLNSLTQLGNELQTNFENSTNRIETLRTTRKRLDDNTAELKQGSEEIMEGARDVANTCYEVNDYAMLLHLSKELQTEVLAIVQSDVTGSWGYVEIFAGQVIKNYFSEDDENIEYLIDEKMNEKGIDTPIYMFREVVRENGKGWNISKKVQRLCHDHLCDMGL